MNKKATFPSPFVGATGAHALIEDSERDLSLGTGR
jgi:hypothetical protein